ncbi:NAD-dependent epimerase/dehydratase family protein [Polaromonas sp. P1(28)-8]|nr:NAD-dependent epimerase/dehydratase family protein [Polaromonas sp. P1(28)-8]
MHILITGGCGFLGARLARTLLARGTLSLAGAAAQPITSITLADRAPPPADLAKDPRIAFVGGDLNALLDCKQLPNAGAALIFHLAAAVSGDCEADFDLGMRSNLDATRALLEGCRALGTQPVLVFSSSVAVFGNSPEQPLPAVIEDLTLPTPQGSYGIQKFIGEQLVADYTRKGFVQGRNVRLMTVSSAPGPPERRGVEFSQRHAARAAGRCARPCAGPSRHGRRAVLPGEYHRRLVVRGAGQQPGVGCPHRRQFAGSHGDGARKWPRRWSVSAGRLRPRCSTGMSMRASRPSWAIGPAGLTRLAPARWDCALTATSRT